MDRIPKFDHRVFARLGFARLEPRGWLRERLLLQASGLGGRIDEVWPTLGPDSGWLGGKGESWERGPYWLDGLVPLAFILGDEGLEAKARAWIEAMKASETPEGFFGPSANADWWPRTVALKALLSWYEAVRDEAVLGLMLRYSRFQLARIEEEPLVNWAAARGAENALVALRLWELTGEGFLLELAQKCLRLGLPWEEVFADFPFPEKTGAYLPRRLFKVFSWSVKTVQRLTGAALVFGHATRPPAPKVRKENGGKLFRAYHFTHNVDYAMAVKHPAVAAAVALARSAEGGKGAGTIDALRDAGAPLGAAVRREAAALCDFALDGAMRHHGLPIGIWTGDEHFSGREPTQGIELCGIVELMHSLETLLELGGDARHADRLELLAFNALPAAFTEDMCAHQYLQQVNQVQVTRARRPWYDNGPEALLFGLEPELGCCAANFHQGFPKLARSLWYSTAEGGLACAVWAPARVRAELRGLPLALEVETAYPLVGGATIRVSMPPGASLELPLLLRVPSWCEGARLSVNGGKAEPMAAPGSFHRVSRRFADGDRIEVELPLRLRLEGRDRGSLCVFRGPILFALAPEERWTSLRGEPPFDYREARPGTPWNYALVLRDPRRDGARDGAEAPGAFEIAVSRAPGLLFRRDDPPIRLKARARRVADWKLSGASAGPLPQSPISHNASILGPEEIVELVPYACARLRVAQFPWTLPSRD